MHYEECSEYCSKSSIVFSVGNDEHQRPQGVPSDTVSSTKGRKSYTIQKKLDVLEMYEKLDGNVSHTAKCLGVPRSCVQDWVKHQDSFHEMKTGRRLSVRKRRRGSAAAGEEGLVSRAGK